MVWNEHRQDCSSLLGSIWKARPLPIYQAFFGEQLKMCEQKCPLRLAVKGLYGQEIWGCSIRAPLNFISINCVEALELDCLFLCWKVEEDLVFSPDFLALFRSAHPKSCMIACQADVCVPWKDILQGVRCVLELTENWFDAHARYCWSFGAGQGISFW